MLLALALLVAAAPDPLVAKFKTAKAPVILDDKTTGGTALTADEVKAHLPANAAAIELGPTVKWFAGPKLTTKTVTALLLRSEHREPHTVTIEHWLLTLDLDGKPLAFINISSSTLIEELSRNVQTARVASDLTVITHGGTLRA